VSRVTEPCTRLALRFGNLARGHLNRDFRPASLATGVARKRGKVEPFVSFDQVDGNSAAARRVADAKFVKRFDAPGLGIRHPAAEEEVGTLLTDRCHSKYPLFLRSNRNSRSRSKEMVNSTVTLFSNCVRNDTNVIDKADVTEESGRNQPSPVAISIERFKAVTIDVGHIVDRSKTGLLEIFD